MFKIKRRLVVEVTEIKIQFCVNFITFYEIMIIIIVYSKQIYPQI